MLRKRGIVFLKYLLLTVILVTAYKVLHYYRLTKDFQCEEQKYLIAQADCVKSATTKLTKEVKEIALTNAAVKEAAVTQPALKDAALTKEAAHDFVHKLHTDYKQVVGRLTIPSLDIDQPVVQGQDNEYYLKHNYKNIKHPFGAIFLDCANQADASDKNTVIYGHNVKSGYMFHALEKLLADDCPQKTPIIILDTLEQRHIYQILAVCLLDESADYRKSNYTDIAFANYLALIKTNNLWSNSPPDLDRQLENKSILTLSTCNNANESQRLVVLALS